MAATVVETPGQPFLDADLAFISPDSAVINTRYVSPGKEHNTARYDQHSVKVFDARANQAAYTLDSCGFTLVKHDSKVGFNVHMCLRKALRLIAVFSYETCATGNCLMQNIPRKWKTSSKN